jgi:hypothetical protein
MFLYGKWDFGLPIICAYYAVWCRESHQIWLYRSGTRRSSESRLTQVQRQCSRSHSHLCGDFNMVTWPNLSPRHDLPCFPQILVTCSCNIYSTDYHSDVLNRGSAIIYTVMKEEVQWQCKSLKLFPSVPRLFCQVKNTKTARSKFPLPSILYTTVLPQ